jgi:hypothetical protein
MTRRGDLDKLPLILLCFYLERSLHTGEVVGSIPTAPTSLRCFAATAGKHPRPKHAKGAQSADVIKPSPPRSV